MNKAAGNTAKSEIRNSRLGRFFAMLLFPLVNRHYDMQQASKAEADSPHSSDEFRRAVAILPQLDDRCRIRKGSKQEIRPLIVGHQSAKSRLPSAKSSPESIRDSASSSPRGLALALLVTTLPRISFPLVAEVATVLIRPWGKRAVSSANTTDQMQAEMR